jgi:isocitrate/isopropylmalate dehydrogenase
MLDCLGTEETKRGAALIRRAVETVLSNPDHRTADLGGHLSTRAMGERILEQL